MKIHEIILESASAGATGSGSIATVNAGMGSVIKRPNPSIYGKKKKTEAYSPFDDPKSNFNLAVADYCRQNKGKTRSDFLELTPGKQEKYLNKYVEGKSPHKKGTKKYKKHMAAMHAG